MEKSKLKLTKLDVIRRQLEMAVRLYFNEADPVSVHTLTAACHEMLAALSERKSRRVLILSGQIFENPEHRKEFRQATSEAKNFFKHADRDPEATYEFNPEANNYLLLDCCDGFELLTGEKNPHFAIYRAWFSMLHPHISKLQMDSQIKQHYLNGGKLDFYQRMLAATAEL